MIQSTRGLANSHEWAEANFFTSSHHLHFFLQFLQRNFTLEGKHTQISILLPKFQTSSQSFSPAFIDHWNKDLRAEFRLAPDLLRAREAFTFPVQNIRATSRGLRPRFACANFPEGFCLLSIKPSRTRTLLRLREFSREIFAYPGIKTSRTRACPSPARISTIILDFSFLCSLGLWYKIPLENLWFSITCSPFICTITYFYLEKCFGL